MAATAFPLLLLFLLIILSSSARAAPDAAAVVSRIAFGSCSNQSEPQPIWDAVLGFRPQVFVWLGDNVYGDSERPFRAFGRDRTVGPWRNTPRFYPSTEEEVRRRYQLARAQPGYARPRETAQIKLELRDVEGRSVHSVEFPISELQPSDVHTIKRQPHTFQRHCTLETELPWFTRYRLSLMLFVIIAVFVASLVLIAITCLSNFTKSSKKSKKE